MGSVSKALLDIVRRLHMNTGHLPNAELERIVRLSGGLEMARIAVKSLRCSICRKSQDPKLPRPGRLKETIGQFNEVVMADIVYVKDTSGETYGYELMVDDGTDWMVSKIVDGKTPDDFYQYIEDGWINWAGLPDRFVADGQFSSEELASKLGRAGVLYVPGASWAPAKRKGGERSKLSGKFFVKRC